ncbi:uncharacterized protein LOC142324695 [Lycorma delicatula]|uniref:uncharacterized protein LOC142324695 n=1 Tax=Lycorma delicatula TaxID=130591 RepID=UPI003F5185F5
MMISSIISRLAILLFGNLYPAYASYKAVRTKNVKEYVKWMMYWIVFALFTCCETFTDVFLGFWFPFYYEIKIILVIWLLSPATKGSSFLYRKFVHPMLTKREPEIDEYLTRAKEQSYHTMLHLGTRGMTYATNVIMQTAIKGGGGIVNHLRRSYSLCDLSSNMDVVSDINRNKGLPQSEDNIDSFVRDQRTTRSMRKAAAGAAAAAAAGNHVDMYFPEVDVNIRSHPSRESVPLGQIRSTDDISSGYSSADPVYVGEMTSEGLMRTSSVGGARARTRGGSTRTASMKRGLTTEDSDLLEDSDSDELPSSLSSWMPTTQTIPFPSVFSPVCITSGPNERILFSTNLDVIKNHMAFLKAFQEAQSFAKNNSLINNSNKQELLNIGTDILIPDDSFSSNACKSEVKCNEKLDSKNTKHQKGLNLIELKENAVTITDIDADNFTINSELKINTDKSSELKSDLKEAEEFHVPLTDVLLSVNNLASVSSQSDDENKQNSQKVNNKVEKSSDDQIYSEESKSKNSVAVCSPVSSVTDLKPPSRKGRIKKRQAPLPPPSNIKNIFNEQNNNDDEDFLDAESDIVSLLDDEKENTHEGNEIKENIETIHLNELDLGFKDDISSVPVNDIEEKIENCKDNLESNKSETGGDLLPNVKKNYFISPSSKLSRFLPKTSSVPSFFGFLQIKDNHSQSVLEGSENVSKDTVTAAVESNQISVSAGSKENVMPVMKNLNEEGTFFIPLTEQNEEEKEEIKEDFKIREMSQSPTTRRKHTDKL